MNYDAKWQVAGVRHSGDLKIGKDTRLHMVGPDEDAVAAVFFDMKTGQGMSEARLIAAAPELLNMLKNVTATLDLTCGDLSTTQKNLVRSAHELISRVEPYHQLLRRPGRPQSHPGPERQQLSGVPAYRRGHRSEWRTDPGNRRRPPAGQPATCGRHL